MKFYMNIIFFSLLANAFSILAAPPAELASFAEVYSFQYERHVVDFAMDASGRLYVLTETEDSLRVEVLDNAGEKVADFNVYKGQTPAPEVIRIEVSEDGSTVLVLGVDIEIDVPINWVLNSKGEDILPQDNVLKYAEWLQVSSSGKYFTCQGYNGFSGIPTVFQQDWSEFSHPFKGISHGFFAGIANGEDRFLFTEKKSSNPYLSLARLPSLEISFTTKLELKDFFLIPHRGGIAVSDSLFVLIRRLPNGGDLLGFNSNTGAIRWVSDCPLKTVDIEFSDCGGFIAVLGGSEVMVLDSLGRNLAFNSLGKPDSVLFGPGFPEVCFFGDLRLIIAKFYHPSLPNSPHSVFVSFDDEWKTPGATSGNANYEGFSLKSGSFVAFQDGGGIGLLKHD